jgi:hypothetical protein
MPAPDRDIRGPAPASFQRGPEPRRYRSCDACGMNRCTHTTYHQHCPDCRYCDGSGLIVIPNRPKEAPDAR